MYKKKERKLKNQCPSVTGFFFKSKKMTKAWKKIYFVKLFIPETSPNQGC